MLFNSVEFIFVFLPIALFVHFSAARLGDVYAVCATVLSSLFFYAWWKPPYVLLLLTLLLASFWLGKTIFSNPGRSRVYAFIGVILNLGVLAYYKYAGFLGSIFSGSEAGPANVPLALSFTTFVLIAFLVEIARNPVAVSLPQFSMFLTFFPHLIAGPIVRWSELGPQLSERFQHIVNWSNIATGLTVFILGLVKKVLIADQLALYVTPVFDAAAARAPVTSTAAWGASYAYSLQLYYDFSGYSDMAVGLGLLFNLRLPVNFAAPFRSTNIVDFWRRWHVTLSRFLRDFLYVPIGGNSRGKIKQSSNLLMTMVLGGLWHGANWTFIAWGAFHGLLLIINHAWRSIAGQSSSRIFAAMGWALTFTAFAISMTFFRAADIQAAGRLLEAMFGFAPAVSEQPIKVSFDFWLMEKGYVNASALSSWFGSYWSLNGTLCTLGVLAFALAIPDTMEFVDYREGDPRSNWRRNWGILRWSPNPFWATAAVATFVVVFASLGHFSEFLYYQF